MATPMIAKYVQLPLLLIAALLLINCGVDDSGNEGLLLEESKAEDTEETEAPVLGGGQEYTCNEDCNEEGFCCTAEGDCIAMKGTVEKDVGNAQCLCIEHNEVFDSEAMDCRSIPVEGDGICHDSEIGRNFYDCPGCKLEDGTFQSVDDQYGIDSPCGVDGTACKLCHEGYTCIVGFCVGIGQ